MLIISQEHQSSHSLVCYYYISLIIFRTKSTTCCSNINWMFLLDTQKNYFEHSNYTVQSCVQVDEQYYYNVFSLQISINQYLIKLYINIYILQVGSFDENATKFYSAEIIIALKYLHDKGIIHRYILLIMCLQVYYVTCIKK